MKGIGLNESIAQESVTDVLLDDILAFPAAVRDRGNALGLYRSESGLYRAALATPFDPLTLEFNTRRLPNAFSMRFNGQAPRRYGELEVPSLVIDFPLEGDKTNISVYEDDITLRDLSRMQKDFEGRPDRLIGNELYLLRRLTGVQARARDEQRKPKREETMNALYAAGRRAMTDWVLVNDVAVPSSSYVTEHGRSFLSFSPVIEEEGEVRWMNPRKEPMDAVTANQIVGYLRGYGLIPNLQPNLAMICGWRNESSPKDASRWKDDYNRRREQRGDE